jgi:hypothetical protein
MILIVLVQILNAYQLGNLSLGIMNGEAIGVKRAAA